MKSGLEDRNNATGESYMYCHAQVSMKSGLEDRNNLFQQSCDERFAALSQ